MFNGWRDPPVNPVMKVYFFNLTNKVMIVIVIMHDNDNDNDNYHQKGGIPRREGASPGGQDRTLCVHPGNGDDDDEYDD